MLSDCSDRAALKIVITTKKFFLSVIEQLKYISQLFKNDKINNYSMFLHEFIVICLDLIKNLLENSQSVKV